MNQKSLFATMRNIVMKATGVRNVYFSDQPNHAPSGEYATIRIASDIDQTAVGAMKHKYSSVDRSVTVTMKVPVTYRVTINFYRGEAIANATKLIGCYRLPSIHADLLRANLGWGGHQPVQNLTALQSNRQEQRSAIVVTLVGEEVASEVVNSIEATRLTVEDEKTNVLIDTDIPSDKLHGVSPKMSYSPTQFIDINVAISATGLSTANFGSAVLFVPSSDLTTSTSIKADEFRTFNTPAEVAEYFKAESETLKVASIWLGGTPATKNLTIYVRKSEDSTWAETLNKARKQLWWYYTFVTTTSYEQATDVEQIAKWCEENGSFFPNCQTGTAAEKIRNETASDDIATKLTTGGYRHCATASHASDAYSLIYLMKHFARINFSATNSTITGEFKKSPGLEAEDLKTSEYSAMEKDTKKCAFYTKIDLQGSTDIGRWKNTITHSTYGEWIDDVINLDAFTNALTVAVYNMIANQTKKLLQTPVGQAMVISACRSVCDQFVSNGYLGQRTYIDPDDAKEKTSIGYEILTKPEDILTISDVDRNKRLGAPIRIRVFRAGAIHGVNINVDVY